MNKERTVITQELCDHVKALLAGGLTLPNAAKFAKIGEATVGRIKAAGFDAAQYAADTDRRRIQAQNRKAEAQKAKAPLIVGKYIDERTKQWTPPTAEQLAKAMAPGAGMEQVTGQIEMDLTEKKPKSCQEALEKYCMEAGLDDRDKKLMRFEAAMVDKILKAMDEDVNKSFIATKTDFILDVMQRQNEKLDKIIDMLGQVLRRKDG